MDFKLSKIIIFLPFLFFLSISNVAFSLSEEESTQESKEKNKANSDNEIQIPEAPDLTQQSRKLLDQVNARINNINTETLKNQLEKYPETVLIDVRTPAELNLLGGHIDSDRHRNIVRGWFEFQIESLVPSKDTPIVT